MARIFNIRSDAKDWCSSPHRIAQFRYQAYEEAKTKANEIETQVIQLEEEKNNAWDESNTAYTDWQVCADTLWGVAQQRICGPKWAKAMELKKKYKDKNAEYLEAKKNT
jgi:hypothetical protein